MAEEGDAFVVGDGYAGVMFEVAVLAWRETFWEVFPVVQVFKNGSDGSKVLRVKLNSALLMRSVLVFWWLRQLDD